MNSFLHLGRSTRLLVALGIATASAVTAAAETNVVRDLDGKIAASVRSVRIDHRSGPVTIVGVDQDFGWKWNLQCRGGADAEEYVRDAELQVVETDGTLQNRFVPPERTLRRSQRSDGVRFLVGLVTGNWRGDDHRQATSTLELRVPKHVAIGLMNKFGTVRASTLTGPLDFDCQHAQIDLSDTSGPIAAATSFATLRANNLGRAHLRNQNGSIHALGVSGDLRAATSFARMHIQGVSGRADLKNQNGEIDASAIQGDVVAATSFARLQVQDVKGRADIKNQNGSIYARRVTSDVVAATSFSELRVEDIGGAAALRAQNGKIEAHRVAGALAAANSFSSMRAQDIQGDVDLESQNGEIVTQGIGGGIRARTSFARMQLEGTGKRFDAHNQNGSVTIIARSRDVERIAVTSSFAPIEVRLPADCKPVIRANTSHGNVRSDFPVTISKGGEAFADATSGAPQLTLRGQNGDIRIHPIANR